MIMVGFINRLLTVVKDSADSAASMAKGMELRAKKDLLKSYGKPIPDDKIQLDKEVKEILAEEENFFK